MVHIKTVDGLWLTIHGDPTGTGLETGCLPRSNNTMSDDRKKTGSPDRDRINVNEDYEIQYWTKSLGVTAAQLREAVKAVGPTSAAVRKHLGK